MDRHDVAKQLIERKAFSPAVVLGAWTILQTGRLALTPTHVWAAALLAYKVYTCRAISAGDEGYDTYSAFQALLPRGVSVNMQSELAVCAAQPTWGCVPTTTRFAIVEEVAHTMGLLGELSNEINDAAKHSLLVPELDDEDDGVFARAVCWAALFRGGMRGLPNWISLVPALVKGYDSSTIVKYGVAIETAVLPGVPGTVLPARKKCMSGKKRKFGQLI